MLTNQTADKLRGLSLKNMAAAYEKQSDSSNAAALTFDDRLGLMVDAEYDGRQTNRQTSLIRKAKYQCPSASLENIDFRSGRNLNRSQIVSLGTCAYIEKHRNVVIVGPTGSGKTYLACALGIAANRASISARYIRLPDLCCELAFARVQGNYTKIVKRYKTVPLLILDEWLLYELRPDETQEVMELMEARCKKLSTIICSQYNPGEWQQRFSNAILADAISDRIVHDAHNIHIKCDPNVESMRKLTGVKEEEIQ